jgi:outer membrane protein OmpA-like peptidoglycan-associated protein
MEAMMRRIVTRFSALAVLALSLSGPARATVCMSGPFILFFATDSALVDRDGLDILDNAVHQAGDCGPASVMIAGFTDTSEDPRVARDRVEVVRAYYLAHGIPRRDLTIRVFGASQQRIATGRGVSERQNRRVEITYGPAEPRRR